MDFFARNMAQKQPDIKNKYSENRAWEFEVYVGRSQAASFIDPRRRRRLTIGGQLDGRSMLGGPVPLDHPDATVDARCYTAGHQWDRRTLAPRQRAAGGHCGTAHASHTSLSGTWGHTVGSQRSGAPVRTLCFRFLIGLSADANTTVSSERRSNFDSNIAKPVLMNRISPSRHRVKGKPGGPRCFS